MKLGIIWLLLVLECLATCHAFSPVAFQSPQRASESVYEDFEGSKATCLLSISQSGKIQKTYTNVNIDPVDMIASIVGGTEHSNGLKPGFPNMAEQPDAAAITGVHSNHHGHVATFAIACIINIFTVLICMAVFSTLRLKYPLMYSGNIVQQVVPLRPTTKETFSGWLDASLRVPTEKAAEYVGLDAALVLEFCDISCKILALIGIPMVCIMCPMHYYFGGKGAELYDIRSIDMGNVIVSHPWLYHLHACIVNIVTILVIRVVYSAMPNFLKLRYAWLKKMKAPRCRTVLVEGIPQGWRSDKKLREFFSTMFGPEVVEGCLVVKDAPDLFKLYSEQEECEDILKDYKDKWQAEGSKPAERPKIREGICGGMCNYHVAGNEVDAIEYYEKRLSELGPQVEEARRQAVRGAEKEGGINCESGFVTFTRRREAEICFNIMAFSSHKDEWMVSVPPPVSDIRWDDLKKPLHRTRVRTVIGYGCTLFLMAFWIPIVMFLTNVSEAVKVGPFQAIWDSFAPGLALMLFLAFLPTILLLIFSSFFSLKSEVFAQHKLQEWYFLFMLFFVIFVTVIGKGLFQAFAKIAERPGLAGQLLAEEMPKATQFYMDFLMLQWGEHAMNFLRLIPLAKFLIYKHFYDEVDAKKMSEPEDQDFFGIGSRSARFTISLLMGIIFCTLSPITPIMASILFGFMRIFYGYLVVFAEVKKPDLGGVFFNTQLKHILLGVGIYNVLMISVLCFRAGNQVPMLIAMPALVYSIFSYWHFSNNYVWKELPFYEVCLIPEDHIVESTTCSTSTCYIQPEFADDDCCEPEPASSSGSQSLRQAATKKITHSLSFKQP